MIWQILAHAGEDHEETVEAVSHSIELSSWYIIVPGFIIASLVIAYIVWLLSKKNLGTVLLVMSVLMLVSGFTLFNISAAVSIIAITAGLIMTLAYTFGSLSTPQKKK